MMQLIPANRVKSGRPMGKKSLMFSAQQRVNLAAYMQTYRTEEYLPKF